MGKIIVSLYLCSAKCRTVKRKRIQLPSQHLNPKNQPKPVL